MYVLNRMVEDSSIYSSSAAETVSLVSGSVQESVGAKLLGFIADNVTGSAGWVQVFDGYGSPTAGEVPICRVQVAANSECSFDPGVFNCLKVSKGIVIALSSTCATYTAISSGLVVSAWWIV
jgi:hypothetical protein